MKKKSLLVFLVVLSIACRKDKPIEEEVLWDRAPYLIAYPSYFTNPQDFLKMPDNNPLTNAGVELGRKLFYDPILSANNTQSCASCHNQKNAFSDNGKKFSEGIHGLFGTRNSMPLFNLGYWESKSKTNHRFFWDGGANDLERQVLAPIQSPIEMDESLLNVVNKLQVHSEYPKLFKKAFGSDSIYIFLVQKAIAQFERTLISFGSKYDKYLQTKNIAVFTQEEYSGMQTLFGVNDNGASGLGDCFHCHGSQGTYFLTDFDFHNNGLDVYPTDSGLYRITNNISDFGKFKTPSLRNLVFTAPYMHDGRFSSLDSVVEFYNSGTKNSIYVDPLIGKHFTHGGTLNLNIKQKADLVSFLKCLTDSTFITNPKFDKP